MKQFEDKMRATQRELVLELITGKTVKNSIGMLDPRLFSGEVQLFAVVDPQTMLWSLKYSAGKLPQTLNQQFTTFRDLLAFTKNYFLSRNIKIVRVID